jgi:hypothetical protein
LILEYLAIVPSFVNLWDDKISNRYTRRQREKKKREREKE